jgi:ComF family protein
MSGRIEITKTGDDQTGRLQLSNRASHAIDICLNFARRIGSQPCLLCSAGSRSGLLCPGCLADLPILPAPRCPQCALPTPHGETCGACLKQPPAFTKSESVYRYAHPLDSLVHALKYRGELAVARFFAEQLAERIGDTPRPDLMIPMPLHANRLRERGFNQAALIAVHLGRLLNLTILNNACRRIRDTPPQVELPLTARRKNLRAAFACDIDLAGRRVALVDDVMTTGASLDELAREVRRAGAAEIHAWTLARAVRN